MMDNEPTESELRSLVEQYGLKVPPDIIAKTFGISKIQLDQITNRALRKIRLALSADLDLSEHFPMIGPNSIKNNSTQK
jgi:DNA-directed RNA polymerase sigma subunit (sigma70/sigma32)